MSTQKELLEAHREELDAKYLAKYPNGKFCLQHFDRAGFWALHWAPKRNTSHVHFRGISVHYYYVSDPRNNRTLGIVHSNHQNSSFGKCRNYDSLDKLIKAARRAGVTEELITAFTQRYENREIEGFWHNFANLWGMLGTLANRRLTQSK